MTTHVDINAMKVTKKPSQASRPLVNNLTSGHNFTDLLCARGVLICTSISNYDMQKESHSPKVHIFIPTLTCSFQEIKVGQLLNNTRRNSRVPLSTSCLTSGITCELPAAWWTLRGAAAQTTPVSVGESGPQASLIIFNHITQRGHPSVFQSFSFHPLLTQKEVHREAFHTFI